MNQKQMSFLQALLTEPTVTRAAEKANISRETAYKYLRDEEFKMELQKRQDECISGTVRFLQGKLAVCSKRLAEIVENPETSAQVAINACNSIFNSCRTMTETEEVIRRLQQIETDIKESDW